MSKKLEIRVVDPNLVPELELCSMLKHKNQPYICYGEYNHIDQALLDKTVNVDNIDEIIGALVRYIGIHELECIVCDINKFNEAFAPAKEMTIAEIEKNNLDIK